MSLAVHWGDGEGIVTPLNRFSPFTSQQQFKLQLHSVERISLPGPDSPRKVSQAAPNCTRRYQCSKYANFFCIKVHKLFPGKSVKMSKTFKKKKTNPNSKQRDK